MVMAVSDEEMARLQQLSINYEPNVEGPSVGERQSSHSITEEYAQADIVYVHKTTVSNSPPPITVSWYRSTELILYVQALAQQFSHYRTVKGDGNCGWRGTAFAPADCAQ
ncbi:MAG: hypothetical protein Q9220_005160 [cf. Caloplaca sp. 1 TL-2023]